MPAIKIKVILKHNVIAHLGLELVHHLLKQCHAHQGVVIVLDDDDGQQEVQQDQDQRISTSKEATRISTSKETARPNHLVDQLRRPWHDHVRQLFILEIGKKQH